jgi:aminoglycoside phosphotransferase (APT) family kinase protein
MATEIDCYLEQFGIKDATVSRIVHNSAMVAAVYKIEQQDHEPLILKICDLPRHCYRERAALELLAGVFQSAPSRPVPRLIGAIPPDGERNGAILMEFIPGTILSGQTLTEDMAYELGGILARVHSMRSEKIEETPLQYFSRKFEENSAECAQHLSQSLIQKCRDYFDAHVDLLRTADGPCMVHGDFHPGNIIINDGVIAGIIDWASTHDGFAQEDLSRIEYAGWNMSDEVQNAFLKGYRTIRSVPDYHTVLPLFRLSKRLDIIGFIVRTGSWNAQYANLYHDICGKIEIQLSSVTP